MKIKLFQVDSFADMPFKGNPAGVCVLKEPLPERAMQSVAAEMNLSETAFAVKKGGNSFDLRWFTPTVEVNLCGHATLATGRVLFDRFKIESDRIEFSTKSGVLVVRRDGKRLAMDFPADPAEPFAIPGNLLEAYGVSKAVETRRSRRMGMPLIEVESAEIVRNLRPDFGKIMSLGDAYGDAAVTASSDTPEYDFISRFFAPKFGINEDPVTGAAHTVLGPYWAEKLGRTHLRAYQASARGGEVELDVRGDRIDLIGQAVVVMEGEMEMG